jgi:hypothetical protein
MIPLFFPGTTSVEYFVGLQVDMVDQPQSVLSKSRMGSYMVDYKIADTLNVKRTIFEFYFGLQKLTGKI